MRFLERAISNLSAGSRQHQMELLWKLDEAMEKLYDEEGKKSIDRALEILDRRGS